jgi:bile acid-coenzyme A ligase
MTATPIPSLLSRLASEHSSRPAVSCGAETIDWTELHRRSNRLARAYQQAGARQGDIIALGLPNSVELVVAACAVWKAGATPLPLSWQLPEAERMGILETARARLAVGVDRAPDGMPVFPAEFRPDQAVSDEDLPVLVSPSWKAATSGGSTGRPKVICSGTAAAFDLDAPDPLAYGRDGALVMPAPLFHNGPFANTFLSLLRGNHVVLLPRFDSEGTLAAVDRYRAHWLFLVPTMMYRIWRLPEEARARYDLSSLRRVWHMSAPCAPWLKRAWIDWLGASVVWELYSATEGVAMTVISGDEYLTHPGSVGRVVQGEISVRDEAGKPVPSGETGEIYMRRPGVETFHYLGAAPRRLGDWITLGDMGQMDSDGYVYLSDRRGDMVISGGQNIYPAEVEAAISAHPLVDDVVVFGIRDEDLGQRLHALVQTSAPELTQEALRQFTGEKIVRYKVPRVFEFTTAPLRDEGGKVRRSRLVAQREAGRQAAR